MDIEKLFEETREGMVKTKGMAGPKLFVEFFDTKNLQEALDITQFKLPDTLEGQQAALFAGGRKFAARHPGFALQRLTLVAQIFTAPLTTAQEMERGVLAHPARKEVLNIEEKSFLTPSGTPSERIWFAQIERGEKNQVTEVTPPQLQPTVILQNTMLYFVHAGILSDQFTDQQLIGMGSLGQLSNPFSLN